MKKVFLIILIVICSGWAWADENLGVKADFTDMPLANIIAICLGIVIILTAVVVLIVWAIKKLGIKKLGPVQMLEEQKKTNEEHNKSISCLHFMDEEIKKIDTDNKSECHQVILEYSMHMHVLLRDLIPDDDQRGNVVANIKVILTGSVIRNHYTTELMPENIGQFRERYLGQIEDFYQNLLSHRGANSLKPWEEAKKTFLNLLNEWITRIKKSVSVGCEEKIEVYTRYKKRFQPTEEWYSVAEECRVKNENYIKMLKI